MTRPTTPQKLEGATPPELPPNRRRELLRSPVARGLLAIAALAGLLGGSVVGAATLSEPGGIATLERSIRAHDVDEPELGDITLDELADELAELGLELRVAPTGDDAHAPADDDAHGDDAHSDDAHDDHAHDDDGELGAPLGTFRVDGDEITPVGEVSPKIATAAEALWGRFVELIPADQRTMVTGFEIAEPGFGAYVYPADNPLDWVLGISADADEWPERDDVLIHEFAHLLTLQATEVPPAADADPGACPTYFTGEGCALKGSTIAAFVERFWPQEQRDLVERIHADQDDDAWLQFYEDHADEFVSEYATTNPAEDIAETFAVFVLQPRPDGDTIADQKVLMLWADADLVELRSRIRANL